MEYVSIESYSVCMGAEWQTRSLRREEGEHREECVPEASVFRASHSFEMKRKDSSRPFARDTHRENRLRPKTVFSRRILKTVSVFLVLEVVVLNNGFLEGVF
jgi:hypothetical protein